MTDEAATALFGYTLENAQHRSEDPHLCADAFLLAILEQQGYSKLVAAYHEAAKGIWYA